MEQKERAEILRMIDEGQVSAQEALDLLSEKPEQAADPQEAFVEEEMPTRDKAPAIPPPPPPDEQAYRLRIKVTDLETGKNKVNIQVPLGWIKLGWAIGTRFAPGLEDLDIHELTQDAPNHLLQVENIEENKRVEIYIE